MKIFLIILIAFFIYAFIENKFFLNVRTEILNEAIDNIKIVHLSDIHKRSFGKYNSRLIKKVKSLKPDIIVFSGDLISRNCYDFYNTEKFIENLSKICPVYYALGNHELYIQKHYGKIYSEFIEILQKNNIHIMNNCFEKLIYNDRKIVIYGTCLKLDTYKKENGYKNLDDYSVEELVEDIGYPDNEAVNILIAHNPFFAEKYAEWGADFTLCGHVHGGAVIVPFIKLPLLSPERKFFPKYAKGIFSIGKMKLLVSGGLGKLRLFNPPEIVVYYI